jgi:hypothetical protein
MSLPKTTSTSEDGNLSFRSFDRQTMFDTEQEVEISGRRFECRNSALFSLESVTSACMDQGSIYEVEVDPVDLVGFRLGTRTPNIYASTATGIRSLGMLTTEQNQGLIEIPVTNCAGGLALRDPSSGAATAAYLTELAGSGERELASLASRQSSLPAVRISGC